MNAMKIKMFAAVLATFASGIASAVPFYWTDWTGTNLYSGIHFKGQGTITTTTSTVTVTYTNENGIGFFQPDGGTDYWVNRPSYTRVTATSPYTSTFVDNIPTGTDIVALSRAGSQTLQFSQAVANPVLAFVSLNGNGYAFLNQDFDILSIGGVDGKDCGYWRCGGVSKKIVDLGSGNFLYELDSSDIGGTEPHGTIRFKGALDALTWTSTADEYWNGFTVGVQGTAAEVFPSSSVPEPGTLALFGLALTGLSTMRRRTS